MIFEGLYILLHNSLKFSQNYYLKLAKGNMS